MTPQQFISKWQRANLSERSAAQQHFLDLCDLLGQPKPAAADPDGAWYTFERGVHKTGGGEGWADVWMRKHFAWEYKRRRRSLLEAYQQLLRYREDLDNPPLLVVCDLDRFEIHTNFTNTATTVFAFDLAHLDEPANLDVLRKLFTEPDALKPGETTEAITRDVADRFSDLADGMRLRNVPADQAAHFLMKLMFCMFAKDIELLPKGLFTRLLTTGANDPPRLTRLLKQLFETMSKGGEFGADAIAHFNGGLFADAEVIPLLAPEIAQLIRANERDWSNVEPSIFGTLFERTLDPAKRSQIGAHYTSKDDILTLLEPVLMAPLRREWAAVKADCDKLWTELQQAVRQGKATKGSKASAKPRQAFEKRLILQGRVTRWIIDSGDMTLESASLYELPHKLVVERVKPSRDTNRDAWLKANWWRPQRMRPAMRQAVEPLTRFLVTTTTSKHRIFVWLQTPILPDHQLIVFARADDLFFGLLHSSVHELWARAQGTQLRERESGFRYTPTTCFETFPFPQPTPPQQAAIAVAAKELDRSRNNWLNPPEWTREEVLEFPGSAYGPWARYVHDADVRGIGTVRYPRLVAKDEHCAKLLAARTLTNLYNQRPTWLDLAHRKLDEAVFAAYGWPPDLRDEEILSRLLALNLACDTGQRGQ